MTDWRFSDPQWIHLIWGVLAITGLLLWLDYRGNRGLERFLATVMHDRLVHRPTSVRRTWRTIQILIGAGGDWARREIRRIARDALSS